MRALVQRIARSSDCGAELIEYALLLPVLLTVIFGIADFGLLFQSYEVISNAAREGARMGVMACDDGGENCYSSDDIQSRVASFVDASLPASHSTPATVAECVTIAADDGPDIIAERVTVTYTYPFRFVGPIAGVLGGSFTTVPLRAVSTMRRESQGACP